MDQQLKQRLVGAVVLGSLAVIFIPIILEGPEDEWEPHTQTIPPPPQLDFRAGMELPLPDAEDATATEPDEASSGQAETASVPEDNSDVTPEPAAAAREPEPAVAPARTTTPSAPASREAAVAAPLADGWYAQVGSFSQQANAARLRDRLTRSGYGAHLQLTDTGKGSSYRVLVGPEQGRENAEKLLRKLATKQRLKGIVIEISARSG